MRRIPSLLVVALALNAATLHAQTPTYAWARFAGNIGNQQASGRAIAVDTQGNVFVAGIGAPSINWGGINLTNCQQYLMKADNSGTVLWAKKIPMRPDFLATDSQGNVYVSASAQGAVNLDGTTVPGDFSTASVLLVKFDPQGTLLWFRNHLPNTDHTTPGRVMVDAADNVYLCGAFNTSITIGGVTYTGQPENGSAVFAVSYAPDGTFRRANATSSAPPVASLNIMAVAACDTTCAIIRGGVFGGVDEFQIGDFNLTVTSEQMPAFNAYLAKWAPNGEVLWAKASGGIGTEDLTDVVVGRRGHIVIGGSFTGDFFDPDSATVFGRRLFLQSQSYNLADMYTASFTPDGEVDWIERAGGNHVDGGPMLSVDAMDNVYAYGGGLSGLMTFGQLEVYPFRGSYIVKFARNGEVRWAKLMMAGVGDGNNCLGAAADTHGNVYVTGMQSDTIRLDAFQNITPASNNFDVFVAKLNNCTPAVSEVNASGPTVFCPGDSVDLIAPDAADHLWSTFATTPVITVEEAGSYSVVTSDMNGCMTWSDTVEVELFAPVVPTATLTDGLLSSTTASAYQWILDGEAIPDATDQTFDPIADGSYAVVTTDANGCVALSPAVFFTSVGLAEALAPIDRVLTLGDGRVTILLGAPVDGLCILNAAGQVVRRVERPAQDRVELQLMAGAYVLRSMRNGVPQSQRFVVMR
ncbi:MAG TPA: hypothetical protein VGE21_09505 [Flavobacteriales bacterium]